MAHSRFASFNISFSRLALLVSAVWLSACDGGSVAQPPTETASIEGSVAQQYADYFPIGAAVSAWHLDHAADALRRDFNRLTCENAMKAQEIHPAEDSYDWAEADRIADFARGRGMKLTGHALLWHRQAPAWMFEGITAGDPDSLSLLKSRLKAHIEAVVNRYKDVVDNWDVVNEAISDDPDKVYRDGPEQSKWYELFGSEEYIYWAFQYAHDALEAIEPGSAAGKLYYNDYTVTVKVDKILTMFAWLESRGIEIDGIGFQSHESMTWPSASDLQSAFDRFIAAGYEIKISELDVTVYDDYRTGSFVASPEVPYTASLAAAQAERFASLFSVYRKNKASISSVTLWGVSDDHTWLDNQPVAGRNDYPLLYEDPSTPKAARTAVMNF
ncbi:MAG TPA: endo-1,4-beta-xylanase [Polyangiaceae bacterium]|nr:endo-1,4-beta-xylanase [Polyangiaceae bacterium]